MKSTFASCIFAATCFFLVTQTSSFAQEVPKKEVLANQLLDQLNVQKTYEAAFASMPKMQEQMMAAQKMSPEQKEKFHQQMQASMEAVKKEMTWDTIKPMFVKIYADNFDEAELNGLIAFYQTPVGQTWIEKQPQIQMATMQAMGQIMPKLQAAIMKASTQTGIKGNEGATSSPAK